MRSSDRWITPGVVIAGLLVSGVVVLGLAGMLTYLADRGVDPGPVLKLTGQIGGGLAGVVSLLLQLVNRKTVTKTERNTGVLAEAVFEVADKLPRPVPRHAADPTTVAADYMGAAPAPRGS